MKGVILLSFVGALIAMTLTYWLLMPLQPRFTSAQTFDKAQLEATFDTLGVDDFLTGELPE